MCVTATAKPNRSLKRPSVLRMVIETLVSVVIILVITLVAMGAHQ